MKKYIIPGFLLLWALPMLAQVHITKKDVSCRGKNDGWLKVNVTNAALPIQSYMWNDGVTLKNRLKVSAGNYCVTVTDNNGCTGVDCITVSQPETSLNLDLSIVPDANTVPCGIAQPVFVTAFATGGGGPYMINGASGATKAIRVSQTMNVRFQVSDQNGCTVEKEQRVYVLPRVCPGDPNEITGPVGYAEDHWVSVRDTMDFEVKFENDPEIATAPAQRVVVTHAFDEDINPYSFRLGSFGFGDYHFDVPGTPAFYQTRLNLVSEIGLYVDVVAGIDVTTNSAFWIFESIDPATGLLPVNPFLGFLPVNDTITHGGEGFVTFFVKPKLPGHTGDTVLANASIIFDINEAIVTNTWSNLIDAVAPSTALDSIPPVSAGNVIHLTWTGSDDAGGSGLDYVELHYAKDGAAYQVFDATFPDSVMTFDFEGEFGSAYAFYIVGVDHVGNREIGIPGERTVTILPRKEIELIRPVTDEYCIRDTLWMEWSLHQIDSVDVFLSTDSGVTFVPLYASLLSSDTMRYIILDDSLAGHDLQIMFHDVSDTTVTFSGVLPIKPLPDVSAGLDKHICVGDVAFLLPGGANTYIWSPDMFINNPVLTIPTVNPTASQEYFVTGTDVFGCRNVDSTWVYVHPQYLDSISYLMCNEDSVFLEGAYQTEEGFYTDSLASQYGCDSVVITHVMLTGPCPFPSPQVYVDRDATGANNGSSWADAFTHLQDALDAVAYYDNIREIWIAEGEYFPSDTVNRNASFLLRDSVEIYGGFLGFETMRDERIADPALVQLSGDLGTPDDSTDNAYHVIRVDSLCGDCRLDGLTVSFGHANGGSAPAQIGAGLWIQGPVFLNHLVIERNTTTLDGAAIYNDGLSAATMIKDCLFRLNSSGIEHDILNANGGSLAFKGINTIQQ